MGEIEKLSRHIKINSYDADRNKILKLSSLFQYFSEIAWEHAKDLGVGFEDLKDISRFWVLTGVNVKVHKMPVWQDNIEVVTWPSGLLKLFFTREFEVYNKDGELLVQATSNWIILDKNTRRPLIPKEFEYLRNETPGPSSLTGPLKIPNVSGLERIGEETPKYTDIDLHQHVNNAVYVRWVENYTKGLDISYKFKVEFLKEMKLDETAEVFYKENDKSRFYELKNSDNNEVIRAFIEKL